MEDNAGAAGEVAWVRSVYLYVMCFVGVLVAAVGAVTFAVGLAHVVIPDFGQRDTVSRFGVGIARIGDGIIDAIEAQQGDSDFCRQIYETEDDIRECEDEQSNQYAAIRDGLAELEDELDRQTRNTAADSTLRGALTLAAGVLVFRVHARRTALFPRGPRRARRRSLLGRRRRRRRRGEPDSAELAAPAPIPFPPAGPPDSPTGPAAI